MWCDRMPCVATSYVSNPSRVGPTRNGTALCPGGSLRRSGTPTSITKRPPGRRCAAALRKQSTWASCVSRLLIVLKTR